MKTRLKDLILPLFFAPAIILVSGNHGGYLRASISLILLLLLCSTALPLIRFIFGSGPITWFFTFPIAYLVHSFLLACCALLFGIRLPVFIAYFLLAAGISIISSLKIRAPSGPEAASPWRRKDSWLLLLWLAVALALVVLPFLHVGALTPRGYAFRAYFNTDVFRNMATAGSLVYTGVPPENPYFSGFPLHYYWFFHVLPAYWMTVLPSFPIESIFVQFAMVTGLASVAVLFLFVRTFTTQRSAVALALPLFAFGGSYEGIFVLRYLSQRHLSWRAFTSLNVDAILRWLYDMPQVDTLFRPLLYAPQHLMIVMIILISILFWRSVSNRRIGPMIFLLVLVLISVGFSVILAAVLLLGTSIVLLVELRRNPRPIALTIATAVILGIAFLYLYLYSFAMFSLHHGDLTLGFNENILQRPISFFVLNWGALLFLGIAGMFFARKRDAWILYLFLGLSFFFILLVQIDVPGLSDVSIKAGYIADSMLLTLSAIFLDELLSRKKNVLAVALVTVLVLPGTLTAYEDEYNSQDIYNSKFTTYISKDQMEVFRWIRRNIDPGVRLQNYDSADPGFITNFVSVLPPFANRSVFLGDVILSQIFQTPKEELEERRKILWYLMQSESPAMISHLAQNEKIEYIMDSGGRGSPFRRKESSRYFKMAYSEGDTGLYKVMAVPLEYERRNLVILISGNDDVLLSARYGRNFYAPEPVEGHLLSRWISDDGEILLKAEVPVSGSLIFFLQSMGKNRTMEVTVDEKPVFTQVVSLSLMKVRIPMQLSAGEHRMLLHCVEGAEGADVYFGGADKRLLSFRVWGLQFASN
jgi:hypothetical protein